MHPLPSFKSLMDNTFPDYAQEGLNAHNYLRRHHGVPLLKLTRELCSVAQEWADNCAKMRSLTYRDDNLYGENIYSCSSKDKNQEIPSGSVIRKAVNAWYEEIRKYQFGTEGGKKGTLHFTQVVWKSTSDIGFGIARSQKGEVYVVANYHPKGNIAGSFVANVPKPGMSSKISIR